MGQSASKAARRRQNKASKSPSSSATAISGSVAGPTSDTALALTSSTRRGSTSSNRVAAEPMTAGSPSSPVSPTSHSTLVRSLSSHRRSSASPRSPVITGPDHLSALPDEILLPIIALLGSTDLATLSRASTRLFRIAVDDSLWKPIVERLYIPNPTPTASTPISGLARRLKISTLGNHAGPPVPTSDYRNFMILLGKSRCLRCGVSCPDPATLLGRKCLRVRGQRFCGDCQNAVFVPETTASTVYCLPTQLLNSPLEKVTRLRAGDGTYFLRHQVEALAISYYGGKEKLEAERNRRRAQFQAAHRDLLESGLMRDRDGRIVMR